ncbi:hypothetical protein PPL_10330 [Heterostelium album PN500]|uniref:Uncharacterized protein n=1 Tax=Heterostelium pallidum (strain ATCC 26659 / Pp 5 / PN500) TaxID=670386 RepID=D3BQ10_HETP5|nr:hypothetical protein PPL_10330 [Heterostelium album PN500]EFA76561.1 hypothetical protein PPL_10330 [Heterostelium album PN500]|eukprot:XP_020428693.1 hypothetical protein PPL_10330 [Heterostelium album PN500]
MTKLFIVRVAPLILIVIVVCLFEYKYVHCVDFNISNTGNATDMEIVDLLYCSNRRCVDFGERCDDQFPFSGPMCYQPYRCVNKTCANPLTLGDPCNINSDCDQAKGQFCVYYFGDGLKICRIANYAQFGESCSVDYECMMGLDCFPGPNGTKVCSTPVTGCINDGQCDQSSVCNFTRVDDEGPVGECVKLNLTSDQCTLFSTIGDCANAYCTPIANGSNIGICTTNPKLGDLCITSRITCNTLANHYCQNFPGSVYGTCQILPKPSFRVCYNVGDCEPYEFCRCDTKASIGYCTTRGQVVGSNCQDSLNVNIFEYNSYQII